MLNRFASLAKKFVKRVINTFLLPFSHEYVSIDDQAALSALERLHKVHEDCFSSCIRDVKKDLGKPKYDLDIIVPIYKVEKYLRQCLDSIFRQKTRYSYRVICIDDGSPDTCGKILDAEYADKGNILIKHQHNRGFSGARNAGLESLDSKYLMFVDSDDFLPSENAVENLLNIALNYDYSLVGGGV